MKNRTLRKSREQWERIVNLYMDSQCVTIKQYIKANERYSQYNKNALAKIFSIKCNRQLKSEIELSFYSRRPHYTGNMLSCDYITEMLDNEKNERFKTSMRKRITKILDKTIKL